MSDELWEAAAQIEAAQEAPDLVTPQQEEEAPSEELTATPKEEEEASAEEIPNAAPSGEGGPVDGSRTFKLKVDGEEVEITEAEAILLAQRGKAADKRFQEASALRKQAEEVINLLKSDPRKALQHPEINVDIRELAEEVLKEHLEVEMMDDKEKQIYKLQKELEQKEAERKATEETKRAEQMKIEEERYTKQYEKDINDTLQSSGLPQTNFTVNRVIHYMQQALDLGYEASAKDVIGLVKQDYQNDIKQLFSAADSSILGDLLGEEGLKKVRGFDVSRLKDPKGQTPAEEKQAPAKKRTKKEKESFNAFFDRLRDELD